MIRQAGGCSEYGAVLQRFLAEDGNREFGPVVRCGVVLGLVVGDAEGCCGQEVVLHFSRVDCWFGFGKNG